MNVISLQDAAQKRVWKVGAYHNSMHAYCVFLFIKLGASVSVSSGDKLDADIVEFRSK